MENNGGTLINGWGTYEDGILTMNRSMGYHGVCFFAGQKFNLKANKTYTLSATVYLTGTNATSNVILGFEGASNPNVTITKETWTKVSKTVSFTEDKENVRVFIQPSNTGNVLQIKEILLCEGTDTNYSPYVANPIELCKIGNYQDKLLQSKGNNLFDKDNANTLDAFVNGNTGLLATPTSNQKSLAIPIQPNTQYTISGVERSASNYGLYSDTTLVIGTSIATTKGQIRNGTMTFTSGANDKWLVFLFKTGSETYGYSNVMLNKGSTALPYEPYGIGKWYIEKQVGKIVLNGSTESWYFTSNCCYTNYIINSVKKPPNNNTKADIICDHYQLDTLANCYNNVTDKRISVNNGGYLYIYDTSFTSANAIKTWLTTNNVTVYYALATPTYTEITDTYLLNQLNGILDMQLVENLCYVDWVGSEAPTMSLLYAGTEDLGIKYIITEDGKKIRTDWRKLGRRKKWKMK